MRYPVDSGLDWLSGLVLPPRCVLCGAHGQRPCLDLCCECERSLAAAGEPLQAGPAPLRTCFAPFEYASPLDHLVHALKYRGQLALGRVLGTLLAERIAARDLHQSVDVVVPVPLHPGRHADRGFNQSAEIARWIARRLGCRLEPRLAARRRDTPPQVGLTLAQRRDNLADAFVVADVRGRNIALVDDVTTTGSTVRALATALREAGAEAVDAWCVARADRRGIHPEPPAEAQASRGRMR